jgi:hypothetical protein
MQQTITVTAGQMKPTVTYKATLNGQPANAGWGIDLGNVGTIPPGPSSTAVFTPSGTAGGLVTISASLNSMTLTRKVMVALTASQNGADASNPAQQQQVPTSVSALTAGGGVGGVGGEGLGTAVSDPATLKALGMPSGNGQAQGLSFIYPYDKTVWPRGLPAPLLMWTSSLGDADAIKIDLKTKSGSFSYSGTFAKPAILMQTMGKFIRHPIPQNVWDMATNSANGAADPLTISLTVALGGMAYGPITETWTIAPAHLSGTIYYNSYGTQLAQNSTGGVGGNGLFGGAVLSIHVGDTAPKLVAGTNTLTTGCRVCHSVAANGSRLVVVQGDYNTTSSYNLSPMGATETVLSIGIGATFPTVYPDGSMMMSESATLRPLPNDQTPVTTTGLNTVADLGTPAFSPDGSLMAFNPMAGSGVKLLQTLYTMSFDKTTNTFGSPKLIADFTGQAADTRPGWAAFFPDSKSVVFEQQTTAGSDGNNNGELYTRKGSKGHLAWTTLNGPMDVTMLDQLNGKGYLPSLAQPASLSCTGDGVPLGGIDPSHQDDQDVNYEPTVNPAGSGGYAWVVFTSRRMYGSVAAIPPFCSDPRGVDLTKNVTTKKLWVAAIDLNAAPGKDSSHPAFYLPAQELLAGNSRGFWVLDPCKADGMSCMTGDQCCNGYCEPDAMGQLVCSNKPPMGTCSGVGDKCTTSADCCDMTNACINGFCTIKSPQ